MKTSADGESTTLQTLPSWLVSGAVHLLTLCLVALLPAKSPQPPPLRIACGEVSRSELMTGVVELSDFADEVNQLTGEGAEADDVFCWLIAQQLPSGGWPASSLSTDASGARSTDLETSALVMLAFLQVGQTHRGGRYEREMQRVAYFLLAQPVKGSGPRPQISSALATLALCELYGRTHDPTLQQPAAIGIKQLCASQNLVTGGWDSGGDKHADLELVTWNLLALREANMARLQVPQANITAAGNWINTQAISHAQHENPAVEPGLLLGRCIFGLQRHPWCEEQIERLTVEESSSRSLCADYFATQVVCDFGTRPAADDWLKRMKEQVKSPRAADRRHDIQATALRVLIDRSRCWKWMNQPTIEDDDFPL